MHGIRWIRTALVLGALGLFASPAHAQPTLAVSPGPGVFSASQGMQLVILIEGLAGLGIVGGQVLLDGGDITGFVLSTFTIEGLSTGIAVRSPRQPMGFYGLGTHTFRVNVTLSDGTQLEAGATWQVLKQLTRFARASMRNTQRFRLATSRRICPWRSPWSLAATSAAQGDVSRPQSKALAPSASARPTGTTSTATATSMGWRDSVSSADRRRISTRATRAAVGLRNSMCSRRQTRWR